MNKILVLFVFLFPVLGFGCASNRMTETQSQPFTRTEGGVEFVVIDAQNPWGQNLKLALIREDDGRGGFNTQIAQIGGDGFFTRIGPSAVQAGGFVAGMAALRPPETNVSATGGSAEQSQGQRQGQRGINSNRGRQGQRQGGQRGSQGQGNPAGVPTFAEIVAAQGQASTVPSEDSP